MIPRIDEGLVRRLETLAALASIAAILVAALVLLGWVLGIASFQSTLPGGPVMFPISAVCAILSGISLLLLWAPPVSSWRRHTAQALAGLLVLLSLLALFEHLAGWDFGIDRLLFDDALSTLPLPNPGRPAVQTSLAYLLLGAALLTFDHEPRRGIRVGQILVLSAAFFPIMSLLGYAYDFEYLYQLNPRIVGMALNTALVILMLCLAALCARPSGGFMTLMTQSSMGSVLLRRLLPALFLLIPAIGWLRIEAEQAGYLTTDTGTALMVVFLIATSIGFLSWNVATFNQLDAQRQSAAEALMWRQALHVAEQEATREGILIVDEHDRVLEYNQRFMEIWRVPASLMERREFRSILDCTLEAVSDPDEQRAKIARLLEYRHETLHDEVDLRCGRSVERYSAPVLSTQGNSFGRVWYFRDVTERRNCERQLRESEQLLRTVIEGAVDLVFIRDREGRYLMVNSAAAEEFACTVEEVIGRLDSDFFSPGAIRQMREADRQVLETRRPLTTEIRLDFRGEERIFSMARHPLQSAAGEAIGIVAIARDITERVRQCEALQQSEARFRELLEASPDALVLVDRQGRIVIVNTQTESMFGYRREELLGQPVEILMPERLREAHVQYRGGFNAHPFVRPLGTAHDFVGLRKDGSEVPLDILLSPLETPEGPAVIAALRDISDRKRILEEVALKTAELRKAEELGQLKGYFLSTISHELKTPLSLILGYAELLEDTGPPSAMLAGIQEGTRRLQEHIDRILDYSALVSGTLPLYKTEVNLHEIVRNVRGMVEPSLKLKDLQLVIEAEPRSGSIYGDSRRITQALHELMTNAVRFTPAGGTVGIRVVPFEDQVRIDVWDEGCGLPGRDFDRVWEAFSQRETKDTLRSGGLGLGLSIVRMLAELHGGRVELVSREREGSTFSIFFPIEMPA